MKFHKLTTLLGLFAVTAFVTLPSIGCSEPTAETGTTTEESGDSTEKEGSDKKPAEGSEAKAGSDKQ